MGSAFDTTAGREDCRELLGASRTSLLRFNNGEQEAALRSGHLSGLGELLGEPPPRPEDGARPPLIITRSLPQPGPCSALCGPGTAWTHTAVRNAVCLPFGATRLPCVPPNKARLRTFPFGCALTFYGFLFLVSFLSAFCLKSSVSRGFTSVPRRALTRGLTRFGEHEA